MYKVTRVINIICKEIVKSIGLPEMHSSNDRANVMYSMLLACF